jgi:hypothetical protein
MTIKTQTLKKVKSQKKSKSKSQLRKTRKVRKHKRGGNPFAAAVAAASAKSSGKAFRAGVRRAEAYKQPISYVARKARAAAGIRASRVLGAASRRR